MNNKLYIITPVIIVGGFVKRLWFFMYTLNEYC